MTLPSPELIQALGVAIAAILTAWQARTHVKLRDLESRLKQVEVERDQLRALFRAAVRHIRDWMAWQLHHNPNVSPPELPKELRDEV